MRYTIITFIDEDGDEFPVLIQGHSTDTLDIAAATELMDRYVAERDYTPCGQVTFSQLERFDN